MTTKIWRGDAPEVAQVTVLTPVNVQIGNTFSIFINGKSVSVIAALGTAAGVCGQLKTAIDASLIQEFAEFTSAITGSSITLTANEPGVPFVVTAGAGNGSIAIDRLQAGFVAANAVQVAAVPVTLTGTFAFAFDDQITSGIAAGASAATVQTALEALSRIGSGNVAVSRTTSADGNDYLYQLTFQGALAARPIADVICTGVMTDPIVRRLTLGSASGAVASEVQQIRLPDGVLFSGTFATTKDSQTTSALSVNADATTLKNAITALSSISTIGIISVTRTAVATQKLDKNIFEVTFSGSEGNAQQTLMTAASVAGFSPSAVRFDVVTTSPGGISLNDIQRITLVGGPTGGTFALTFGANTTAGLAYNAAAATVQTALQGLASIGAGNATVAGVAGGPYTVTFAGALASAPQSLIVGTSSLTGGVTESLTVVTTTASSGPAHYDDPKNWLPAGVPVNGDAVIFEGTAGECLYGLDQSAVTLASLAVSMTWRNGHLGLPVANSAGYQEYRPTRLQIGATSIVIGKDTGSGPSRIYLDTGTVATTLEVIDSGSSFDDDPVIQWIGDNTANAISIAGGNFGSPQGSYLTAVCDTIRITGGQTVLRNVQIDGSFRNNGSQVRAYNCTLGGQLFEI